MGFRIPDYNTTPKTKHNIFILSPTPFYFYSFPPFPYFFHPSYLPSVFIQYFFPFLSLPVSHFPASAPHVFDRLSFLAAHPAPFFFFRPIPTCSLSLSLPLSLFPHLNLAIIFLSFALSLARYTGTSSVTHFSYSLLYLDSLACPYLCPSCSAPHTSIILPLSIFPLPHWHTRFFCSTSVSPSHPRSFSFLYSTQSVSCTLPFRLFCPRTLPLSFPLSLSACSSCTLRLFPHYVPKCFSVHSQHPSQIFLLHSLHHHLFLPSPDLCSVHQHVLYYALKHDIIIIIYTMK
jgi:hypothetical protein